MIQRNHSRNSIGQHRLFALQLFLIVQLLIAQPSPTNYEYDRTFSAESSVSKLIACQ